MGKTSACIKLIQILSCRDIVDRNELADILEINPRNITEYIKEIEVAGYTVESIRGKNGGYRLDKNELLPVVKMTNSEKDIISEALEFLVKSPDFLKKDEALQAFGKICASYSNNNPLTPITMIDRFPLAMDKNLLQARYVALESAMNSQIKCIITYNSSKNITKEHIIHPYNLFVYNGSWFLVAWNESVNDFGYFKLNRIENITTTKNRFSRMKTYSDSDYVDQFGMKQNGEFYHIELQLKDLYTVMNERIYGKNQKIVKIDDHLINFSCDMQNKQMIKSFVLGFGSKCKVISPKWLIDEIKEELENSYYQY